MTKKTSEKFPFARQQQPTLLENGFTKLFKIEDSFASIFVGHDSKIFKKKKLKLETFNSAAAHTMGFG
jgi:hypothetical protein